MTSASAMVMAVPDDVVVIAGAALLGLGLPFVIVGAITAMQLNTPNDLMGRVTGVDNFLVNAGQALGIATGAALISELHYRSLCYLAAGVLALATGYLVTRPEQRQTTARTGRSDGATGTAASVR